MVGRSPGVGATRLSVSSLLFFPGLGLSLFVLIIVADIYNMCTLFTNKCRGIGVGTG